MQYVKKAQKILGSKLDRMTPADWRIVGLALMEGRTANKSDPLFSKWKQDNGFGELSKHECSEALWLANDENWDFFSKPQLDKGWNVRSARRLKNELERNENGTYTTRILEFMQPKKVYTSEEIADALSLTSDRVSKRMYDLRKRGAVVSPERMKYRLPTKQERSEDTPDKGGDFSFGKLARITNGLRQALKFRRAGWDHIPSSHDPVTADNNWNGLAVMACDTETWSEAITKKARKGTTLKMSHGKTYEVDGYAEGYLVRVVIDRVRVPVNTSGEALDEHMEVLKK